MARNYRTNIDLSQNQLLNARIHNTGTAPASPGLGQAYYDTGSNILYYWNGTQWVDLNNISLTGSAPINVNISGTSYTISIDNVTGSTAGAMIPSDKNKLDGATSSNVLGSLVMRDASGNITVSRILGLTAPSLGTDAANKDYVDSEIVANARFTEVSDPLTISLTGNTYSIGINATSSDVANFVVQRDGSNSISVTRVTGLTAPSLPSDAANKDYVDGLVQGLDVKESCRVISTSTIVLNGLQTIDGISLVAGERVLVAGQGGDLATANADNGIYIVAAGAWTRATDADEDAEVTAALYTFVSEGSTYENTGWVLSTNDDIVVGTTPLQFIQFSQAGVINAGDGLSKSGNIISVDLTTNSGLTFSAGDLAINANNGLNVTTNTLKLGGTLTENTTIDGAGNTYNLTISEGLNLAMEDWGTIVLGSNTTFDIGAGDLTNTFTNSFIVTDGSAVKEGIVYAGDYTATFVTNSLITKQYVDSALSGITGDIESVDAGAGLTGGGTMGAVTLNIIGGTGITVNADDIEVDGSALAGAGITWSGTLDINANNGLNVTSDFVKLGGSLTENTTIDGAGNTYNLTISEGLNLAMEDWGTVVLGSNTTFDIGGADITNNFTNSFVVTDFSAVKEGIVYAGDYTATFVTNSLITKQYVDTAISGITGDIESVDAGAGLTGGGTMGAVTLNIIGGTGISVNADDIEVDGNALSGTGITWSGSEFSVSYGAGLTTSGTNLVAYPDNSTLQTNLLGQLEVIPDTFPTKYTQTSVILGNAEGVKTITHNLNSTFVNVSVFDSTTFEEYEVDVIRVDANNITIEGSGPTFSVNVNVIG